MLTDSLPPFPSIENVAFQYIANAFGYCVSSHGHVYRCIFFFFSPKIHRTWSERPGSPNVRTGHLQITINGRHTRIHTLVLEAFVGPCPDGMECCHNDGNSQNNVLDNLRWDTRLHNVHDMVKHGRSPRGERNHFARLTDTKVLTIRSLYSQGATQQQLSRQFQVSRGAISAIVNGKTWKHLPIQDNPLKKTHKLTQQQKEQICQMKHDGVINSVIASTFNIHPSLIQTLYYGKPSRGFAKSLANKH